MISPLLSMTETLIEKRLLRGRKILFNKDDAFLKPLVEILAKADHQSIILWAIELAEELSIAADDAYVKEAINFCKMWAQGEVKMPLARKYILKVHSEAKENTFIKGLYLHAIAQGLSVIHTSKHALGLPIYELSALVYQNPDAFMPYIEVKKQHYIVVLKKMIDCDKTHYKWAAFLKGKDDD